MAMYNGGFPTSYQPVFYPQYPQYQAPAQPATPTAQAPQNNSSIIWVQGEAGAKSYLVAPNTTVQLWDSERQTIYLKSADASGMPTLKTLDYTIREASQTPSTPVMEAPTNYVTKAEFDTLQSQIEALKADLAAMNEKQRRRRALDDE